LRILVLGDFQGKFPSRLKRNLQKESFDLVIGVGDYGGIDDWRPWIKKDFERSAKKGLPRLSPEEFFGKRKLRELINKDIKSTKDVFYKLSKLKKKFIFIYGNGDDYWYNHPEYWDNQSLKKQKRFLRRFNNFKGITYSKTRFKGFGFIGFGGYMDIDAYFNTDDLRYQTKPMVRKRLKIYARMRKRFFRLLSEAYKGDKNKDNKIFVFHYPPTGVFDIIKGGWKGNPMKGKSSGVRFYKEAIKRYKPRLVLCGHMHEYSGFKKMNNGKTLVVNPGDAGEGKYAIVEFTGDKADKIKVIMRK